MDHAHHNHQMEAVAGTPASGMENMDHGGHDMPGMHMSMFYHFGSMETVLFSWWTTKNAGGIVLSSFILICLCFFYEGIKWARVHFKKRAHEEAVALGEHNAVPLRRKMTPLMMADFGLHVIQLILGYSLMLVFMTFNVWLCLAVVFGESIAHLFFCYWYPELNRFKGFGGSEENCCG